MDVLIVDDQRPFRSVARTVVNLVGGWRVAAEAETGEDAVAAAERVRPGVVLMDINLPGISGIEATRRIIASHPGTTVVLLSTYAAADLPRRRHHLRGDDVPQQGGPHARHPARAALTAAIGVGRLHPAPTGPLPRTAALPAVALPSTATPSGRLDTESGESRDTGLRRAAGDDRTAG